MNTKDDILSRIAAYKRKEVEAAKEERPLRIETRSAADASPPSCDFTIERGSRSINQAATVTIAALVSSIQNSAVNTPSARPV